HFAGIARVIRYTAWVYLGFTILATLYLGWHYIADDIGGLLIGWLAVSIGAFVTGNTRRQRRRRLADEEAGILDPADRLDGRKATPEPSI
ncbi:MAG: phosphatase PAP2 family protein, partial [Aeromicrobium sp.]